MAKTQHPESYLQLSRNGVFRYRRVIPEQLRDIAGRREILSSLGTKNPKLATQLYPNTHAKAEAWLQSVIATKQAGSEFRQPLPYPFVQAIDHLPLSRKKRLAAAKLAEGNTPLSEALRIYFDEKRLDRARTVRINEKSRCIGYLTEALGADRDVRSLTRQDARTFRDYLARRGMMPGSVSKNIKLVAAIVQVALVEKQILIRNPFHRFRVINEVAAIDSRLPLTSDEIAIARSLNVNAELSGIVNLLALTGSRLNEMAGLQWDDVVMADSPSTFDPIRYGA